MNCKICSNKTINIFEAKILGRYIIKYYQCHSCKFIQTEEVYWLKEAYSEAIATLDIGLVTRNIELSEKTSTILKKYFDGDKIFLDYGGGYGLFVRIMRDKGFNFYRQDIYCENLFAKYFDIGNLNEFEKQGFELLTAFEVFEHLANPLMEIEKMFKYSSSILFSTVIQPDVKFTDPSEWWYFSPETGQHIAFYTKSSLEYIAKYFKKKFYSNGSTLHLLTDKELPISIFSLPFFERLINKIKPRNDKSLLQKDYSYIKKLNQSQ